MVQNILRPSIRQPDSVRVARVAGRVADAHAGHALAVAQQAGDLALVGDRDAVGEDLAHPHERCGERNRRPVGARRDLPGDRAHRVEHARVGERLEAVVRHHEGAGPVGPGGGALEHERVEAASAQGPRQAEPDDARADDHHPHRAGPAPIRSRWSRRRCGR
jgi:hypothetical protein